METKTFILFVFGMFEDMEDVGFFCNEILGKSEYITRVRYVIEKSQNIIVIFESHLPYSELSNQLYSLLYTDNIKFYFLFDRQSLVTAHLPKEVKEFIFKPAVKENIIKIDYEKNSPKINMDLDELLDKIDKSGINSLTPEEKKFLDNFDK